MLFREEDTRKLELRFKSHLDALEVCLVAIGIFLLQRTADELLSRHAKLDRTADEILTSAKVDRRSYPNQLGYTWHRDNAGETIFFEDVLGRQTHLPSLFFRDLSTFQSMVEVIFRDHPGLTKIFSGEYELVDEERSLLVTYGEKVPDNIIKNINRGTLSKVDVWETQIYPGVRLLMNMIVYAKVMAPRASLLPSSRRRCLRCGVLNRGQRTLNLRTWYDPTCVPVLKVADSTLHELLP